MHLASGVWMNSCCIVEFHGDRPYLEQELLLLFPLCCSVTAAEEGAVREGALESWWRLVAVFI